MIKIGFGNRVKPKTFEYIPRYYDEAKEELKQRLSMYDDSVNEEQSMEQIKGRIKSGLRMKHYGDPSVRATATKQSNFRLVIIIATLFMVTYLIMSSDKILNALEVFAK